MPPRRWDPLERSRSWGFFLVSPDIPGAGSPWLLTCAPLGRGTERDGAGGSVGTGAIISGLGSRGWKFQGLEVPGAGSPWLLTCAPLGRGTAGRGWREFQGLEAPGY